MKTFDKKDVFSWSNAEEAKQYIGKDCYFAHSIGVLSEHIKTGVIGTLKDIFNSNHDAISCAFGDGTCHCPALVSALLPLQHPRRSPGTDRSRHHGLQ